MKQCIITRDGDPSAITEAAFNTALNIGGYYRHSTETEEMLYPYSADTTNYRIDLGNGRERCFDRSVFFTLVNAEEKRKKFCKENGQAYAPAFAHYEADGYHALLPPTEENLQFVRTSKSSDSTAATEIHRQNRCRDPQGRVCRYIRDKDGNRILNSEGKPIDSRCTDCPRAGWIGGNRINCCLCHTCKADCERCPKLKESNSALSADNFEDAGFQIPDPNDYEKIIEDKLLLDTLFAALDGDSEALLKAVHFDGLDLMELAREIQKDEPDVKLKTLHQRLLRQYKKIMAQIKESVQ